MIRKTAIIMLTFGAVGTFVAGSTSFLVPLFATFGVDPQEGAYIALQVEAGMLVLTRSHVVPRTQPAPVVRRWDLGAVSLIQVSEPRRFVWHKLEKDFGSPPQAVSYYGPTGPSAPRGTHVMTQVGIHYLLLLVILALYLTITFIRGPFRRWRRRRRNSCLGCGYDLTGNVSGVCPECGGELEER
ncbi:MAG: hypothetical protein JSU63_07235 [Phycisphaerales bacterium]|nr:MAG: hypothetical protein JSU63_07235 [Phycisphaerales bacterium]